MKNARPSMGSGGRVNGGSTRPLTTNENHFRGLIGCVETFLCLIPVERKEIDFSDPVVGYSDPSVDDI
jgi:hypothetical protein